MGVHDGVQPGFDGGLVGLADLVEDVADFVRPAALDRDFVIDHGQRGDEPLAAVGANQFEAFAGQAALVEIIEEALPPDGALAAREAKVEDLQGI